MKILWSYSSTKWVWIVATAPLILGAAFGVIKHIFMQKQTWRELVKPRADWGPSDHVIRQLRKQFEAREYVGSQASRYLSRHLLEKAHTKTYRLDVKYATETERPSAAAEPQVEDKRDRETD
ncbi:uncharacterized protein LOC126376736 [Pectinophora gossypiella]|uniref:uncharacterized protein LOC126376736 n=1 Tax=Pectinophora gossypiella TaxID=13191 RepID=UPI00214E3F63|nr:uncharacterized protein LOC126376736 [Pectinophora gossypiella]